MATDALTVKVEFDKENAMNCIKNVLMEEYGMALDELAELCKAKQEGRLVELPKGYDGSLFRVWRGQILSSERFAWTLKELGKTVFLDREAAEARLKGVQNDG